VQSYKVSKFNITLFKKIHNLINSETPGHCKYIRLLFNWYTESTFQRTGRFITEENSQIAHLITCPATAVRLMKPKRNN
jgi:hypothetical protein